MSVAAKQIVTNVREWPKLANFVIHGQSDARIHSVTLIEKCSGAEFCTVAALESNGMDSMVRARRFAPCSAVE